MRYGFRNNIPVWRHLQAGHAASADIAGILGKFPDHLRAYLFGLILPAQLKLSARPGLKSRAGA